MRTKAVIIEEPFARCGPSRNDVGKAVRVKKLAASVAVE